MPESACCRWAAACVFVAALGVYTLGLATAPYWLDSSEFAAAAAGLGVAHPPGHPLALLLGKALALLPLGPACLRVGLSQALCAAAAAALLSVLGARLAARAAVALGAEASAVPLLPLWLCGAGAALCTSLGYAVAFQAVRPEVYALHRLLALGALYGLLLHDEGDRRGLPLAALCLGLGLANHHFLSLLLLVPVPLLLWPRDERWRELTRSVALACGLGGLGLLLYLYLPLRAGQHPLVNWGAPTSLSRIFWVVSARAFQKSVKEPRGEDADVFGAVVEQAGPALLLLALLGLYLLLRQRQTRRLGAYLLAVIGLHGGGRAVLGFDPVNPDAHGYLVPAGDALALLGCAGFGGLVRLGLYLSRPALAQALGALLLVGGVAWGGRDLRASGRAGFTDLDALIGGWLEELPPRARLLSSHFQTVFALWYLQGVEGQRPDVEHWHPNFLANPGYRDDLLRRFRESGDLPTLLDDNGLRVDALLAMARTRPTHVEYELGTPPALAAALTPSGLGEVLGPPPSPERAAAAQRRRAAVEARLDLGEPETRRNVLWRAYLHATLACQTGDRPTYDAERARTRRLLGGARSPEMDELEKLCR